MIPSVLRICAQKSLIIYTYMYMYIYIKKYELSDYSIIYLLFYKTFLNHSSIRFTFLLLENHVTLVQ